MTPSEQSRLGQVLCVSGAKAVAPLLKLTKTIIYNTLELISIASIV